MALRYKKTGATNPETTMAIQPVIVIVVVYAWKLNVCLGFCMKSRFFVTASGCMKVITSDLAIVTENAAAAVDRVQFIVNIS